MQLRKSSKIPRNSLCFCGSGKKYKKCCLVKQQEQESIQLEALRMAKETKETES